MKLVRLLAGVLVLSLVLISGCNQEPIEETESELQLYWFIPDGMRADPDLFNIYEWAEKGELPNIKKMMDQGAYGYSIPVFPTHTPVNFATLLTGSYPKTHGVADGPMHVEGHPLDRVSVGGFSSVAKKVPPIWSTLEDSGHKVAIISTPGSTPPEIDSGIVVRGRWGGWGADFHAINFESKQDNTQRIKQGRASRLFFFGPELTQYVNPKPAASFKDAPQSFSKPQEIKLEAWGATYFAYIYDSTNDSTTNYDNIAFANNKKEIFESISQGEWSNWHDTTLKWNSRDVLSHVRFHVIILDDDGFFRVRLFFNNVNEYIAQPGAIADDLTTYVSPMMDFVDNFPPQLIYYDEDKQTFLQEMNYTFDWHTKAISYMISEHNPSVIIHDIYSPNQMLTSRWWLGYIDPNSKRYAQKDETERALLLGEVKDMYKRLDTMIGEILENANDNTIIVLSSDHGAAPLDKWVRINNVLAKNNLLHFEINKQTGEPIIDWKNTKAIYLKMDNIYINPAGLDGNWTRASGSEYEALREAVTKILIDLEDDNGKKPIASITKWEDVEAFLDLPQDRVGDLIIANEAGYGWNEEMTEDLEYFSIPLKTGYKQAIHPENANAMWTPFIIMGPGVKKNYEIAEPIKHAMQYPTIMTLLNQPLPKFVEEQPLNEILE